MTTLGYVFVAFGWAFVLGMAWKQADDSDARNR